VVRLRRALVARYGVELGVEACAEATAWAWAHRTRLLAMTNPVGYLYRVGQSAVRAQSRWHRAPLFPPEPFDDELPVPDGDLAAALAKLAPDQRAAVMLVHAYGYRYAEAADLLDIPVSTLKNHLHRGGRKLRQLLESHRGS
jgi:DNA-directed RNA polymerase specialized sigma24 family protein